MKTPDPTRQEIEEYLNNTFYDNQEYSYVEKLIFGAYQKALNDCNEKAIREANPLLMELWEQYQLALKLCQSSVDNKTSS